MKLSAVVTIVPFLTLTSGARLCDRLIGIRTDITTLSASLSSSILTSPATLTAAFTSLMSASNFKRPVGSVG